MLYINVWKPWNVREVMAPLSIKRIFPRVGEWILFDADRGLGLSEPEGVTTKYHKFDDDASILFLKSSSECLFAFVAIAAIYAVVKTLV